MNNDLVAKAHTHTKKALDALISKYDADEFSIEVSETRKVDLEIHDDLCKALDAIEAIRDEVK